MVLIIVQIRSGAKVLKLWYGCVANDSSMLPDVYNEYSGRRLDDGQLISDEYLAAAVVAFVGRTKTELTCVSSRCVVAEAASALGQCVEYSLSKLIDENVETAGNRTDAFTVLMKGAQERLHVPDKWRVEAPNKKLDLKNATIVWLQRKKLGWESSYTKQLEVMFVNVLANMPWTIDGNHQTLAYRGYHVPAHFEPFQGCNKPELGKKCKPIYGASPVILEDMC